MKRILLLLAATVSILILVGCGPEDRLVGPDKPSGTYVSLDGNSEVDFLPGDHFRFRTGLTQSAAYRRTGEGTYTFKDNIITTRGADGSVGRIGVKDDGTLIQFLFGVVRWDVVAPSLVMRKK